MGGGEWGWEERITICLYLPEDIKKWQTVVWYRNQIRRVIIESRLFKDVQEGLLSDLAEKSVLCYHMEVMAMDTAIVR